MKELFETAGGIFEVFGWEVRSFGDEQAVVIDGDVWHVCCGDALMKLIRWELSERDLQWKYLDELWGWADRVAKNGDGLSDYEVEDVMISAPTAVKLGLVKKVLS